MILAYDITPVFAVVVRALVPSPVQKGQVETCVSSRNVTRTDADLAVPYHIYLIIPAVWCLPRIFK